MPVATEQVELDQIGGLFTGIGQQFDVADYEETLKHCIPDIIAAHRQNLDEEIDSEGDPWPALAPITVEKKRKQGAPQPEHALWRWGSLRKSVLDPTDRYHVQEIQNRGLIFGSDAHSWDKEKQEWNPSAHLMQFGGITVIDGHTVYVPPRPFIGLNRDVLDRITEKVADNAVESMKLKP